MPARWTALLTGLACALAVGPAQAQAQTPPPVGVAPASTVVVLDRDLLFSQSRFGQRISRDIEEASEDLAAENQAIQADLEAEELALTARRDAMEMEAFRGLATAFDERVTRIRQTQDAKARAIGQETERAQQVFLEQVNPVLVQLARETGALVILDRRNVIASADQVDITTLALERIDAVLGEGEALLRTPPEPRPDRPAAADPAAGEGRLPRPAPAR